MSADTATVNHSHPLEARRRGVCVELWNGFGLTVANVEVTLEVNSDGLQGASRIPG